MKPRRAAAECGGRCAPPGAKLRLQARGRCTCGDAPAGSEATLGRKAAPLSAATSTQVVVKRQKAVPVNTQSPVLRTAPNGSGHGAQQDKGTTWWPGACVQAACRRPRAGSRVPHSNPNPDGEPETPVRDAGNARAAERHSKPRWAERLRLADQSGGTPGSVVRHTRPGPAHVRAAGNSGLAASFRPVPPGPQRSTGPAPLSPGPSIL